MKRFLFLSLLLITSLCLRGEDATIVRSGKCGPYITYKLMSDGTLYINGTGDMYSWPKLITNSYDDTSVMPSYIGSAKNIVISEGVTNIGDHAFYKCTNLLSVSIPQTVTRIGERSFGNCNKLGVINLPDGLTSIGQSCFENCGELSSIVIPNGVTKVKTTTFKGCSGLTSITIGSSVSSVEEGAFEGCSNVKELVYAEGCTKTLQTNLTSLTSIAIPNSVTSIGSYSFYNCTSLTSIAIPNSVTSIESYSFYNCTNLSSINLPDGVTSIGRSALAGCRNLTAMRIPNSVSSIGEYCFDGCSGVSFIELPNNLTTLPQHLFQNCTGLETVIIGEGMTSIGAYAFDGCTGVKSIYCKALVPPSFGSTFNNEIRQNATLYVPNRNSSYAHYVAHDKWGTIQNIQEIDMLLLDEYISDTSLPVLPMVELNDDTPFSNQSSSMVQNLSYIRTFNNVNWQALYVPFKMNYEDWCNDFEVAKINNFHQFDTDDNGEFDNLQMEVIKVKSGTLKANHPYLIKAKSPGEKVIELLDTRLYACLEKNCVCNSMETTYTFTGTYAGMSGEDMYNNSYYSMGGGSLILAEDATANLKPYRWYLKMEGRDGQVIPTPSSVRVMVCDGETCSIETLSFDNASTPLYSVDGRMVENSKAKGLYIINGKKVLR